MTSLRTKNALTSAPPASAAQAIGSAPIVIPPTAVASQSRAWAATSSAERQEAGRAAGSRAWRRPGTGRCGRSSARPRRSRARGRAARRPGARGRSSMQSSDIAAAHASRRARPISGAVIHRVLVACRRWSAAALVIASFAHVRARPDSPAHPSTSRTRSSPAVDDDRAGSGTSQHGTAAALHRRRRQHPDLAVPLARADRQPVGAARDSRPCSPCWSTGSGSGYLARFSQRPRADARRGDRMRTAPQ